MFSEEQSSRSSRRIRGSQQSDEISRGEEGASVEQNEK